ncbi:hypothetical protein BG015_000270 [Linnemannia schmuckeri]|uniref:Uncharacterized protein n=1 Tax=Linnemannia schmuckeri TaxID=64567 RepID=A0A9P5S6U3_9FUNG|nr:hypothetical protein BG015_000270 [Linnemannia schmuckeri]
MTFKIYDLDNTGAFCRKHSSTSRRIWLAGCSSCDTKAIQIIVAECEALELLNVLWTTSNNYRQLCLVLNDAIELPWACTKIQELTLTIAVSDEPLHDLAEGTIPYYDRLPPTTLSEAEEQQLEPLEAFYCQIGALTELRRLNLRALFFHPSREYEHFVDF